MSSTSRTEVDRVKKELAELRRQVEGLRAALAQGDVDVAQRERRILELQQQVRESDRRNREKQEELEWVRAVAAEDQARLADELRAAAEELAATRGSAAFQVAEGMRRRIKRWFPAGTLRGRMASRGRRAAYRSLERRSRRRLAEQVSAEQLPAEASDPLTVALQTGTVPESTPQGYRNWIERHEPSGKELDRQRGSVARLPYRPTISILVPTWEPPLGLLWETIGSVVAQSYGRWEACLADGSADPSVRDALTELANSDKRIKVRLLDKNRGIGGNTNEAVAMASGQYVAFLDQTDLLAPFALYRVVEALNRNPDTDLLYSDWDLLSADGSARFNPFFTPEWSPDLLLSSNYVAHLLVVRRELVNQVGGFRPEMDGAQDWDLALRITEQSDRISRIPQVLYHWRTDPSSTVFSLRPKPEAALRQERAVQEHLDRNNERGQVVRDEVGMLRVRWTPADAPKVSIIIPTKHNRPLLQRCLAGISRSSYQNHEVLIVETAGRDPNREAWYRTLEKRFPFRVLWWAEPFNYSAVNNWAAREATGDILLFLNDDTEPLSPEWLDEVLGWLGREEVGVVGGQLVLEDDTIQHSGVVIGLDGFAEHLFRGMVPGSWSPLGSTEWYRDVTAVTGACLAVRRDVFEKAGGWDERFELCGSDVELCLRIRRAGLRAVVVPTVKLRHLEAATRGAHVPAEDYCVSFWHYQRYLYEGDPFFSPNLSPTHTVPNFKDAGDTPAIALVSRVIGRDLELKPPGNETDHAQAMARVCRVSQEDLLAISETQRSTAGRRDLRTVNWFIPDFENPFYGGIHTIFRFADHFKREYGVESRFVVIGTGPEEFIRSGLTVTFPGLADSEIYIAPQGAAGRLDAVPGSDAAVATLWVTAYPLAQWRGAERMFYFVQDYEPMFYPAGALYALAEETYRMGYYGIANTPPLKEIYESYGGRATAFTPCVDATVFNHEARTERRDGDPFTVFFYGRPGHPRNCYELAVEALRTVKEDLQDRVHIMTAGSWSALNGARKEPWIDRLGLIDYSETADLYRRCDAGLVLSVSKHPTYIPLQLMACGALVVANDNPANGWLLRDGENCLLAEPTAGRLAEILREGLLDLDLRAQLTARARQDIADRHVDWVPEMDRIFRFLCDPDS
jgi:O-antigen biosynthesis protein